MRASHPQQNYVGTLGIRAQVHSTSPKFEGISVVKQITTELGFFFTSQPSIPIKRPHVWLLRSLTMNNPDW
jgi:hypothetical protein